MVMPAPAVAGPGGAAPGTVGDVRRSNLALVLGAIADFPPGTHPSRAQVAGATGLTKASVSSLVLDLLDAGIIREIGLNPQGRGRPGVGLELSPSRAVMGMEINVDYISAAVVDLAGTVLIREIQDRDNRDSLDGPVVAALAVLVARVRSAAGEQGVEVLGGGLAVPGLVDPAASRVLTAPNLGWVNVDLDLDALLPEAPLGVELFNEANAAALAELRHRPDGAANFLFVSGEVGVGGGIVIGSELFTGPGGHAGEVGHIVVDPDGGHCSCGGTGCLETVAGQDAIFFAAGLAPDGNSRSALMSLLLKALEAGEPRAVSAVGRAGRCLGIALASTARVVNIDSVVLGGHFALLEPWLRAPLLESLAKYAPGKYASSQVTVSAVGESGALLGAAGSVIRSLVEAPHLLHA
ncbi:ROK family protein [Arthrobacter sp. B1I2]|uniref:ROK family protein n=1 Tax=Arthrobacter sp. B1I2 TaxID=3042263 RepID=UPI002782919F|nr:ROK family protein [Arthrobacter sp. B1I2]MDQ0731905.1 putative NBD/HSP70 family sugar kinase [Arthrobacter sp. B1I2]